MVDILSIHSHVSAQEEDDGHREADDRHSADDIKHQHIMVLHPFLLWPWLGVRNPHHTNMQVKEEKP